MAAIKTTFGSGGANLTPSKSAGEPSLADALRDAVDDIAELRTKIIALLAKMDLDAGITDTDYAATITPAAQKLTKA